MIRQLLRPLRRGVWLAMAAPTIWILATAAPALALVLVTATVETDPVHASVDAADDTAIWIHPTDPAKSTVIGTDNKGWGLAVYDLAGDELFYDPSVRPNNVDLRYNVPLGGDAVPLVAFSKVPDGSIGVYTVDPTTRNVVDVAARTFPGLAQQSPVPAGFCLYRSASTQKLYGFVVNLFAVEQWELFDNGHGKIDAARVRTLPLNTDEAEGCVADDRTGALYVSDENMGIWKYGAEPTSGTSRTLMASVASGTVRGDVEGLAIYKAAGGGGYLIASSQHAHRFDVFGRNANDHLGAFRVEPGDTIDGVTTTDGIEVSNFGLGPSFPEGLFAAQDDVNTGGNQNFKYVPWGAIARAFSPALTIDTTYDPRTEGAAGGNRPPFVSAGADISLAPEATPKVALDATVIDDGLPTSAVSTTWTVSSAPEGGSAAFTDDHAVDTAVQLSKPGTYVLRLRADDGQLRFSDTVVVTVATVATEARVTSGTDDAEEHASGVMELSSSDLELVQESDAQAVGLRFPALDVPPGATIVAASIQLQVDEAGSTATALHVAADDADDASPFTTAQGDIRGRPLTTATAAWEAPVWPTVGASGSDQRIGGLHAVLQEVVDRPGWAAGNAVAFVVTGTGKRVAEAVEGDAAGAARLQVQYSPPRATPTDPPTEGPTEPALNSAPAVNAGLAQTVRADVTQLSGAVSDDGLPGGALDIEWSRLSGPAGGTVTFTDASAAQTTAAFSEPGTYVLELTASDGALESSDTVTITVTPTVVRSRRVARARDDAEERADGAVVLRDASLDLGETQRGRQTVGLRFSDLGIPRGAVVTRAWVQFQTAQRRGTTAAFVVRAHAADDAPTFAAAERSISTRRRTKAAVVWEPAAWQTVGSSGTRQRTPDLRAVVQAVVNRTKWRSGNAFALIITGTGRRTAHSFDGDPLGAPLLHVEYR